jgi:single-strand DNA-binding protein
MSSVNKVILVGHLGKDPEGRSFQSGGKIVNMSIATSERWKDRTSGEQKERTEWHNVVVMNDGLVKVAEQYLKKGAKVYIEGQLRTRKWQDTNGNDRFTTEVVLGAFNSALVLLDRREADPGRHDYSSYGESRGGRARAGAGAGAGAGGPVDDLDDDIPF